MPEKILLDTDILSYFLKGYPEVVESLENHESQHGPVAISRISIIEVLGGLRAKGATGQEARFVDFLRSRTVLELTEKAGEQAADIFAHLVKTGRHSGRYDIFIAAIAKVNGYSLCTNNLKDYKNIPGLELVNWRTV